MQSAARSRPPARCGLRPPAPRRRRAHRRLLRHRHVLHASGRGRGGRHPAGPSARLRRCRCAHRLCRKHRRRCGAQHGRRRSRGVGRHHRSRRSGPLRALLAAVDAGAASHRGRRPRDLPNRIRRWRWVRRRDAAHETWRTYSSCFATRRCRPRLRMHRPERDRRACRAHRAAWRHRHAGGHGADGPDASTSISTASSRTASSLLGSNYGSCIPARDFPRIAEDIVSGRLPLADLISETIALDEMEDAFEAMRRRDGARRVITFER